MEWALSRVEFTLIGVGKQRLKIGNRHKIERLVGGC